MLCEQLATSLRSHQHICDNPDEVTLKLQSELDHLSNWFIYNKLSVNSSQTKVVLFTSRCSCHKNVKLELSLCEQPIEHLKEIKYLGLLLDPHLSFDNHIKILCSKIKSRAKLLWKMRGFIEMELANILYISLIHPHSIVTSYLMAQWKATKQNYRFNKILHLEQF